MAWSCQWEGKRNVIVIITYYYAHIIIMIIITMGQEETFGDDGYVYGIDCGDSCTGV